MDEAAAPDNVEGLQHCSDRVLPAPRILVDLNFKICLQLYDMLIIVAQKYNTELTVSWLMLLSIEPLRFRSWLEGRALKRKHCQRHNGPEG